MRFYFFAVYRYLCLPLYRKIDFVLVYEEDKTESLDNPGFTFDADHPDPPAPSPSTNQK